MSREIDRNNMTEEDKIYLAQRGQLDPFEVPVDQQRRWLDPTQNNVPLAQRANTGDANTVNISKEEYESLLQLRAAQQEATDVRSLMGDTGVEAAEGEPAEADEEQAETDQYEEMRKRDLLVEVTNRNERREAEGKDPLPIDGSASVLRDLLRQDDAEQEG